MLCRANCKSSKYHHKVLRTSCQIVLDDFSLLSSYQTKQNPFRCITLCELYRLGAVRRVCACKTNDIHPLASRTIWFFFFLFTALRNKNSFNVICEKNMKFIMFSLPLPDNGPEGAWLRSGSFLLRNYPKLMWAWFRAQTYRCAWNFYGISSVAREK